MSKNVYKNRQEFFHKESKKKVVFLKWLDQETASCLDKENMAFLQLSREDLDKNYTTKAAVERNTRERHAGRMW